MQDPISLAAKLVPILEPLEERIGTEHYRVVPSTFNSIDESLRALPLKREWRWQSIEMHLKRFAPKTLILQLPSFWQVEPFVHAASRAAGAPVCIIEPQNYPLDKAAIRLAEANALVAEATEANAIADYLYTAQVALPPFWILIHAADAPTWDTPRLLKSGNVHIAEEVHLAPGVPLLVQCAESAAAKSGHYHYSDLFTWSADLARPAISTDALLFTLTDFTLPFALTEKGLCPCGNMLLARAS